VVRLTYEEIAQVYDLSKGTIGRIVKEVRETRKGG